MDNKFDLLQIDDKIKSYATAFNFLRAINALSYGTEEDFIRSKMESCLKDFIISEDCAKHYHEFWSSKNIEIVDSKQVEMKNPYRGFNYTDPDYEESKKESKEYWIMDFKKVLLPDGWYLKKGCPCGRGIAPDSFCVMDETNKLVEILRYFPDYNDTEKKSALEKFCDTIDDTLDDDMDKI